MVFSNLRKNFIQKCKNTIMSRLCILKAHLLDNNFGKNSKLQSFILYSVSSEFYAAFLARKDKSFYFIILQHLLCISLSSKVFKKGKWHKNLERWFA